jgi:hypothetical protein
MAFDGHLLKINDIELPNRYINMKTYSCKPIVRRLIRSYYTADGKQHEIYSPHTTSEIKFSTNAMKKAAVDAFIGYFHSGSGLTIEFWDQKTGTYYTSNTFKTNDFEFKHYKVRDIEIIYQPIDIVLISL